MVQASDEDLLRLFERLHGRMVGSVRAEVVYDEDGELAGVACMKGSQECWRATVAELALDFAVLQLLAEGDE